MFGRQALCGAAGDGGHTHDLRVVAGKLDFDKEDASLLNACGTTGTPLLLFTIIFVKYPEKCLKMLSLKYLTTHELSDSFLGFKIWRTLETLWEMYIMRKLYGIQVFFFFA